VRKGCSDLEQALQIWQLFDATKLLTTSLLSDRVLAAFLLATFLLEVIMPEPLKLKSICGNYVTGPNFWGREIDIELLYQRIDRGEHITLAAQRRMGKTSLMKELQRQLSSQEDRPWLCLFIDLQQAQGPKGAIAALATELWLYPDLCTRQDWRARIGNIFRRFAENGKNQNTETEFNKKELYGRLLDAITGDWREKGDQLFDMLAKSENPVLLMLDEFPILINEILMGGTRTITPEKRSRVNEFLLWLRSNSIEHQGKIRIILSGSIGLAPMLRRANLSATVNNFTNFELPPWDHDTAAGCLRALAQSHGIRFTNGAETAMVEKLGFCIPYHVQLFFQRVHDKCMRRKNMLCDTGDVDEIYREKMLGTSSHAELSHYEERLKLVFNDKEYSLIVDLLTEAATSRLLRQDAVATIAACFSAERADIEVILQTLMHDGYLKKTPEGEYVFFSYLLRDWWLRQHGRGYTPIAQRTAR
jgi:hypothetical protein